MSGPKTTPISGTAPPYKTEDKSTGVFTAVVNNGRIAAFNGISDYKYRAQRQQTFTFPASQFTSGPFSAQAAPTQFSIAAASIPGRIENVALQWTVNETGGANPITPQLAAYQLNPIGQQAISFAFNSGNVTMQQLSSDSIYTSCQFLTPAQLANATAFNQLNMSSSTFASPTAIAASGSATYTLQLPMCCFIGTVPSISSGNLIANVQWNQNGITSGTGVSAIVNPQLIISCHQNDSTDALLKNQLSASNIDAISNFPVLYQQTYSLVLTAGQMTQQLLQGLPQGFFPMACLLIRSSKSGAGLYTFSTLNGSGSEFGGTVGMINATGQNLLGTAPLSGAYLRGFQQYLESQGQMSSVVAVYWLYFAEAVNSFLSNANLTRGYWQSDGQSSIQITPGNSFSTGTYNVDLLFWGAGSLKIANKNVTVNNIQ